MHVFGRKPEYLESTQACHTEGRQPGLTQDLHAALAAKKNNNNKKTRVNKRLKFQSSKLEHRLRRAVREINRHLIEAESSKHCYL